MEDWFDEEDKEQEEFDKEFRSIFAKSDWDKYNNEYECNFDDEDFKFFYDVVMPIAFSYLHCMIRNFNDTKSLFYHFAINDDKVDPNKISHSDVFKILLRSISTVPQAILSHTGDKYAPLMDALEKKDEGLFVSILNSLDEDTLDIIKSLVGHYNGIFKFFLFSKLLEGMNRDKTETVAFNKMIQSLNEWHTDKEREDNYMETAISFLKYEYMFYRFFNEQEKYHIYNFIENIDDKYEEKLKQLYLGIFESIWDMTKKGKEDLKPIFMEQFVGESESAIDLHESLCRLFLEAKASYTFGDTVLKYNGAEDDDETEKSEANTTSPKPSSFTIDATNPNLYGSGNENYKYIRGLRTEYKDPLWIENFINWLAQSKQINDDNDTKLLLSTRLLGRDMTGGNLFDENGEPRKIEWLGKVNNLFYMIKYMFDNNNKVTPTQLFFSCKNDTKGLLAGKNHSQCSKDAEKEFKEMIDEK